MLLELSVVKSFLFRSRLYYKQCAAFLENKKEFFKLKNSNLRHLDHDHKKRNGVCFVVKFVHRLRDQRTKNS
jgi:uncharacterized protein YigA (DUF484 family)